VYTSILYAFPMSTLKKKLAWNVHYMHILFLFKLI